MAELGRVPGGEERRGADAVVALELVSKTPVVPLLHLLSGSSGDGRPGQEPGSQDQAKRQSKGNKEEKGEKRKAELDLNV